MYSSAATAKNNLQPPSTRVLRQALEAALSEKLIDAIISGSTFYFNLAGHHYRCNGRIRGFGRVRLVIESLTYVRAVARPLHAQEVLEQLLKALPTTENQRNQFLKELNKTIHWSQWNETQLAPHPNRRSLSWKDLEIAMHEGHPYHPCFKARIGFNTEDHHRYAPECGNNIKLEWIAILKDFCRPSKKGDSELWLHQELLCEKTLTHFANTLNQLSLNADNYLFIPVHPWQWENIIKPTIKPDSKKAIHMGRGGDDYIASQSVRTLFNQSNPKASDVKLPLNITNTSAPRYLLSHGIDSAPKISEWIAKTVSCDQFFQQHPIIVLREYIGVRVDEAQLLGSKNSQICQLGAICRESVEKHVKHGQKAVPFMALTLTEIDGKPFIDPWVKQYGLTRWLRQVIEILVLPVWHLLARHGLAIEAHGQNTILIHDKGWPVALAARDFHESLEYVSEFLSDMDSEPDFKENPIYTDAKPNEFYWMQSVEALRELVMDTLFAFHLSELALLCEEHYQFSENDFWRIVRDCLQRYSDLDLCAPDRLEALGYREPCVAIESLLRKKLCPQGQEYHQRVANPLAQQFNGNN